MKIIQLYYAVFTVLAMAFSNLRKALNNASFLQDGLYKLIPHYLTAARFNAARFLYRVQYNVVGGIAGVAHARYAGTRLQQPEVAFNSLININHYTIY